mmetsp:Transcript_31897/g.70889  ORF Transcript_31897/g.70889 Transcript_31897/m.70889 type:complete len:398 (+) Transcript_31897:595-1788(+)
MTPSCGRQAEPRARQVRQVVRVVHCDRVPGPVPIVVVHQLPHSLAVAHIDGAAVGPFRAVGRLPPSTDAAGKQHLQVPLDGRPIRAARWVQRVQRAAFERMRPGVVRADEDGHHDVFAWPVSRFPVGEGVILVQAPVREVGAVLSQVAGGLLDDLGAARVSRVQDDVAVSASMAIPVRPGLADVLNGFGHVQAVCGAAHIHGDKEVVGLVSISYTGACAEEALLEHEGQGAVRVADVEPCIILGRQLIYVDPGAPLACPVAQTCQQLWLAILTRGEGAVIAIVAWVAVAPSCHTLAPLVALVQAVVHGCMEGAVSLPVELVRLAHLGHTARTLAAVRTPVPTGTVTPLLLCIAHAIACATCISCSLLRSFVRPFGNHKLIILCMVALLCQTNPSLRR